MEKRLAWMLGLLLFSLPAAAQSPAQQPAEEPAGELEDLQVRLPPHKGDIDEMDKVRTVRALVDFNIPNFFFDNGRPRGISYDALMEFEKFLNQKLHPDDRTGKEKIRVVLVPSTAARVSSDLLNGNGDLVAAPIYITEKATKVADFVSVATQQDVVVSGPDSPPLATLQDLSGKEVYVFKPSLAWDKLTELNKQLAEAKKPRVTLLPADGNLARSDVIEMADAGLVQYTVVPRHVAALWQNVFTDLKIYDGAPVTGKTEAGWAVRKDSPKLRALLEEFAKTHRQGTAYFATLAGAYLKNTRYVKNNTNTESFKRFNEMKGSFQKYANQYRFPWMLIAAEAFQESGLNQNAKSAVGAIGVMQVMPTTAASPPVSIPDVSNVDPNIHAGVKLLKYIRDDYFKNDPMDQLNKTLMTLAAYNAGPARIKQCRQLAATMGLDPNVWFQNVEYAVAKRVGAETVGYVGNIYKYYLGWQLMAEREAERAKLKQSHEAKNQPPPQKK